MSTMINQCLLPFRSALALLSGVIGALLITASPARADGDGSHVECHDYVCVVIVGSPGGNGSSNGSRADGSGGCSWKGRVVPCKTRSGYFNGSDGCYYRVANPTPPRDIVDWGSHEPGTTGGSVYAAFCPGVDPPTKYVWLRSSPRPGPTPGELARRAFASLTLLKPSAGRYPDGTLEDGRHYTVVRAYTWYWTDPSDFKTLTAKAAVGSVWAEVTVKPTALTFTPGDGNGAVSCAGPGTVWNDSYGAWAPSPSDCDYRYPHSSIHEPHNVVTATYGIRWQVTWVGSGNTSGTLPDQTTTATSTFAVAEVQSVVTH